MKFSKAKLMNDGDNWLCLKVDEPAKARKFISEMKDKPYVAELKEYREKRSLDANAYFWVLCGKLAEHNKIPRDLVYIEAIKNIGGNYDTVCVVDKAVDKLCKGWQRNGLGWITETFPSKIEGCVNVHLYYGSSTYDKAQMGRLIDNIVQDCEAVGIVTMTPRELSLLVDGWEDKCKA